MGKGRGATCRILLLLFTVSGFGGGFLLVVVAVVGLLWKMWKAVLMLPCVLL